MTNEQIEKIKSRCRIKTKEQFISECSKKEISSDWYSFTYDESKPVSFDGTHLYYGKYGVTSEYVLLRMWDAAFEKLSEYKKDYLRKQLRVKSEMISVRISVKEFIDKADKYPEVLVSTISHSKAPDPALISAGWIYKGYDSYMGYNNYYKITDIRTVLGKIIISYKKIKAECEYGYTWVINEYDIPEDMREEIAEYIHSSVNGNKETIPYTVFDYSLKMKIASRFEQS